MVPHLLYMFNDLFGVRDFDKDSLIRFFFTVRKNYRGVPYHNWKHGFCVAHSMYVIIKGSPCVFNHLEHCSSELFVTIWTIEGQPTNFFWNLILHLWIYIAQTHTLNITSIVQLLQEGDEEKRAGKIPVPMMDRDKPEEQIEFISGFCIPCYELIVKLIPPSAPLLQESKKNLEQYKLMKKSQEKCTLNDVDFRLYLFFYLYYYGRLDFYLCKIHAIILLLLIEELIDSHLPLVLVQGFIIKIKST
ncbi:hypothetical protein Avbf_13292, partial [Armadillidium vulgare]